MWPADASAQPVERTDAHDDLGGRDAKSAQCDDIDGGARPNSTRSSRFREWWK